MRTLNSRIKADFIRKDKAETPQSARRAPTDFALWSDSTLKQAPASGSRRPTEGIGADVFTDNANAASPSKRDRPRSRTFTFSKGDSPTKKHKSERSTSTHRASKSVDLTKSPSSKSLSSLAAEVGASVRNRGNKLAIPEDFVAYLRKVPKPEEVEVGKLHKLRLLLRNETVTWVDRFISLGGMTEIVGLLHRIMQVEWR